jgi:hypothetical protein
MSSGLMKERLGMLEQGIMRLQAQSLSRLVMKLRLIGSTRRLGKASRDSQAREMYYVAHKSRILRELNAFCELQI